MTGVKLLNQAAMLLHTYRPVQSGLYVLFVNNKGIGLEKAGSGYRRRHIIAMLTARDINVGLEAAKWDAVKVKIARYGREGLI